MKAVHAVAKISCCKQELKLRTESCLHLPYKVNNNYEQKLFCVYIHPKL